MFLLFVHITCLFYRQVCFISNGLPRCISQHKKFACHDIAEILLTLALNTNQSINQSIIT